MCGIAGYINLTARETPADMCRNLSHMAEALSHRGPDDSGAWVDADDGVAFGHRRLSIIDLSADGHQPMVSRCSRYVIAFNGEIYNFPDLRSRLEACGETFRGHSDTEVMLGAISRWGLDKAVEEFNGMFAFAVWDRVRRELTLARDRLGEKPLYYGIVNGRFWFASELKALRANEAFSAEISNEAIALYLRYGFIPAPYAIYKSVRKLGPGCLLQFNPFSGDRKVEPSAYWRAAAAAESGAAEPFRGNPLDAVHELHNVLKDAVRIRMHADVPVGAFLSGGIDSSTVVGLMQSLSDRPVHTYTIGFTEAGYNEAKHAKAVAAHLGTAHTELYVGATDLIATIPSLCFTFDEPFSDSSQIPTLLVSRLARRDVIVSLSGDGGDELFGGYTRHISGPALWNSTKWMRPGWREGAADLLAGVAALGWMRHPRVATLFRRANDGRSVSQRLDRLASVLRAPDQDAMYYAMLAQSEPADVLAGPVREPSLPLDAQPALRSVLHRLMYLDMTMYLPDDILVKLDRTTMAVSLESRVPLLDHRVVELAWRMSPQWLQRDGSAKWPLRQILYQYVPAALVDRPKMGFSVPVGKWLRGPLREWAEDLLSERALQSDGIFHVKAVRKRWEEHLSEQFNWQSGLWSILMFSAWLRREREAPGANSGALFLRQHAH